MEYNFTEIEKHSKAYWNEHKVYKVNNPAEGETPKPKYYVLDMFPYPSGAGLHVGHPLGYIASDIYARYKRLCGYNVLHPMGFDEFGLPAEQYAIETGQHPADTTRKNTQRYKEQLNNIGFSFDWDREVGTSKPDYYKWTQWIFLQLFHSWYNRTTNKAQPIAELAAIFEKEGNENHPCPQGDSTQFDSATWNSYSEKEKRAVLMQYRLAYQGYAQVWWCEALGTVLANDEVVNGVSERGGHPVERKNMRQWFLRITEYADRLLNSLDTLDWSDAMKEMQRNWIGKSMGAIVKFSLPKNLPPAPPEGGGGDSQALVGRGNQQQKPGWNTADPVLFNVIKEHKQAQKDNPTEAEEILWTQLRGDKLGIKFRRQHIIDRFIADFICLPAKLIIEVDGKIHDQQKEQDAERTERLEELGFKVVRFTNDQVIADIDSVIEEIKKNLTPPSEGEADAQSTQHNTSPSFGGGWGEVSVFTTRPDTIFGVDFIVLAPEHELVAQITTPEQKEAVDTYVQYVKGRSERERQAEVKSVTGCFTGAYAIHPLNNNLIPIWISEYVLAGYGTGAIMGVPSGDERDHRFAKHFNIPITNIFGDKYTGEDAYAEKAGTIQNSGFISGMSIADAANTVIDMLEKLEQGNRKVNYRLRDAGFSRQRYWGEPFPIVYVDDVPYGNDEEPVKSNPALHKLPVELPMVEHYKPGPEGQGPLANIDEWMADNRETNTMPGYAGSSWYFLRYMDPHNNNEFAGRNATDYWKQVDLYVGGTEHAVGHLLYSRMWTKALCDLGHIGFDEPFKKLLNQGMIQGNSYFVKTFLATDEKGYEHNFILSFKNTQEYYTPKEFEHAGVCYFILKDDTPKSKLHTHRLRYAHFFVDTKNRLSKSNFKKSLLIGNGLPEDNFDEEMKYIIWDGKTEEGEEYIQCNSEVEKMSKSKYNVVNPDDIVTQYGADTFRMYEMFLGPIEMSKPWDTKGIEGVHRFLKKLWRLYADEQNGWIVTDDAATDAELKVLHKTIKKITEDMERFSFNTSISQFMITVNELTTLNCHKRAILEPLVVLICPFAPHLAEELWHKLGTKGAQRDSVVTAVFPQFEEKYVTENTKNYPIAINGKPRVEMEFALDAPQAAIEAAVLANETVQKWLEGNAPKKFIYVKGKMINVVI